MKTDDSGSVCVKLTVVTKDPGAWIAGLAELGELEDTSQVAEWTVQRVKTPAVLRGMPIRVQAYVGPPTADVTVGWVGADRIVSDGTTEVPDVSISSVPRVTGAPGKETLQAALVAALREAAQKAA